MNRGRLSGTFLRKAGIYTVIGSKTKQNKKDFHIKKILYIAFHNPIKTHFCGTLQAHTLDFRKERKHRTTRLPEKKFMQNIKCYSTFSSNHDMSNRPHDASTFKYKFLFLQKNKKDQKSESGKAKSLAGLESIYKTWQRKTLFTATICFLAH